jgi:tRNA 2-thiocytidine biosynthesis protein TtcA
MMKDFLPCIKPPWSRLGKKIESQIRKALLEYEMLEGVQKLAVALSGGKDSLSMLFFLKAISGHGVPPFEMTAINIRGKVSCGAEISQELLEHCCNRLQIPLVVKTIKENPEKLSCYLCSRRRRSLLFEAAKEVGAKTIAFGHHRDDNAETLLMNLFQKGEFAGLLPKLKMVRYGVTIIRPLIFLPEEMIRSFAQQSGFLRLSCQCPIGALSYRKKVDELLDEVEQLFPNARNNIANASLLFGSKKAELFLENQETVS